MEKKSAVIVFVRHPELGKVKTRLAATMGNEKALAVYKFLLLHTFNLIKDLDMPVYVFYADTVISDDIWKSGNIIKQLQEGHNLGEKMTHAFKKVFEDGYSKAVIIGSDCYELTTEFITDAFAQLHTKDIIIGPAKDGGYYMLGMNAPFKEVFTDIEWSTSTVLQKTLDLIHQQCYSLSKLPMLTDVDTEQDISFAF